MKYDSVPIFQLKLGYQHVSMFSSVVYFMPFDLIIIDLRKTIRNFLVIFCKIFYSAFVAWV